LLKKYPPIPNYQNGFCSLQKLNTIRIR